MMKNQSRSSDLNDDNGTRPDHHIIRFKIGVAAHCQSIIFLTWDQSLDDASVSYESYLKF